MKKGFLFLAVVLMTAFTSMAQKETRNLEGFTSVSFGVPGDLFITVGDKFSVTLEGDKSVLKNIITELSGNKLIIKKENRLSQLNEKIVVRVTLPDLESLLVSGSGVAEVVTPVSSDKLTLFVSGSGKIITGDTEADTFSCNVSGSGSIEIAGKGTADQGEIVISGSGNYTGLQLEIDHLEVIVSGSGNCRCKAGDSLDAVVSGSGNIIYAGNPKIDSRVSGSGRIKSL